MKKKAKENGEDLEKLEIPKFSFPKVNIIQSTMTRAIQTADEIKKVLTEQNVDWQLKEESDLIAEAMPFARFQQWLHASPSAGESQGRQRAASADLQLRCRIHAQLLHAGFQPAMIV